MLFFTSATRKHPSAQREGSSSAGRVLPHAIGHPSVCITNSAGTCPEHPFSAPCAPSWRIEAISHSLLWAAQPPDSEVNAEQNGAAPLGAAFHIPIQRSVCGKKVASLGWREGGWQARGNQKQGREELEEGNRSRRWQLKQKLGMGGSNKQWHTAADLNQRGTGALFCAHPPPRTYSSFQESRISPRDLRLISGIQSHSALLSVKTSTDTYQSIRHPLPVADTQSAAASYPAARVSGRRLSK